MKEFRGWSGSGFSDDITVSRRGFTEGGTTRGYRPGPLTPGRWAAELGVAAVVGPDQGDLDGLVNWRVELQLETDKGFNRPAYRPARYRARPAVTGAAWYAGDMHVHTDQSGDAKEAPPGAVFDYAFGAAGLDFVQITNHNTDAGWGEWGRFQAAHPGKLIARNIEITTYRGHVNAPGVGKVVDYRTGPVFKRAEDGTLVPLRQARPISAVFDAVHANAGVTTINHPTIFDARVPPFATICRGCSWEYDDGETDYAKVDAVEVETGPQGLRLPDNPGPSPFTPLALDFYRHAMDVAGHPLAAVSGSDSHSGGNVSAADVTGSPVGTPTTMVYATELSERAIAEAVRDGHTYVRSFGLASPKLELTAADGSIMGDTVHAPSTTMTARVTGPGAGLEPLVLEVLNNGNVEALVPVTSTDFTHTFAAVAPNRYSLQVMRGTAIEAVSTPIQVSDTPVPASRLKAEVLDRLVVAGLPRVRCRVSGALPAACRVALVRRGKVLAAGETALARPGTVTVRLRFTKAGRRALRQVTLPRVRVIATAVGADGTEVSRTRRGRLVPPR
jgi:hypothetical protein